jgi:hypothetical protein
MITSFLFFFVFMVSTFLMNEISIIKSSQSMRYLVGIAAILLISGFINIFYNWHYFKEYFGVKISIIIELTLFGT